MPTALVLSRQDLPMLDRSKYAAAEGLAAAATCSPTARASREVILIATGSEVHARDRRLRGAERRRGPRPRRQPPLLVPVRPPGRGVPRERPAAAVQARVAVEQASTLGWDRYVGPQGKIVGMHTFGASAPLKEVEKKFGFTPERVVEAARELIGDRK